MQGGLIEGSNIAYKSRTLNIRLLHSSDPHLLLFLHSNRRTHHTHLPQWRPLSSALPSSSLSCSSWTPSPVNIPNNIPNQECTHNRWEQEERLGERRGRRRGEKRGLQSGKVNFGDSRWEWIKEKEWESDREKGWKEGWKDNNKCIPNRDTLNKDTLNPTQLDDDRKYVVSKKRKEGFFRKIDVNLSSFSFFVEIDSDQRNEINRRQPQQNDLNHVLVWKNWKLITERRQERFGREREREQEEHVRKSTNDFCLSEALAWE